MKFAIKVIWADGSEEYVKQGAETAQFSTRAKAIEKADFFKMGMDDGECQSINVVPYPKTK